MTLQIYQNLQNYHGGLCKCQGIIFDVFRVDEKLNFYFMDITFYVKK
jgi:hypothetical protein